MEENEEMHWWVLRDLKRPNAKEPAYKQLEAVCFEVFVPMKEVLVLRQGRHFRKRVPVIRDLLFVHSTREQLDPEVEKTPTLQYRYAHGAAYRMPMTVRTAEMQRFIHAVNAADEPVYFLPGEVTPDMLGREIRLVGGPLNGYEGKLLTVQGSKNRRLLVELPGFFSAGIKVNPEYIQLLQSDCKPTHARKC